MITRQKIQQLSDSCAKLLYCSENIEGSNTKDLMEHNLSIKQALRKIVIANEISDRMIICIIGLQGTGKTSLIKNYYCIDDDTMNIALGRGERLPVLITEADVRTVETYAVGIEKTANSYATRKEKITKEQFVDFSKAENEDTAIMYMELLVPRKYVDKSARVSYMLLPGYERKESYWNTLIEFSVQCADTAVFVVTPEKIADANNAQLIEKINGIFGKNVIYAITYSDLKSDENEGFKNTLMELVGAEMDESDRFVCTGAYTNEEKNNRWKKMLQNAIEKYSADPQAMDQRTTEYLEKVIRTELRPAVTEIKKYVTNVTDEILTGFTHSSWLNAFDKEAAKIRKRFQKSLSKEFSIALNEDKDDLLNSMQSGKNKLDYLRRNIFGDSLKDVENSRKLIDSVMKNRDGQYRYQNAFAKSIVTNTDLLCTVKENDESKISDVTSGISLMKKENDEKALILQDVTTILNTKDRKQELVSKQPVEIMKAIVDCGTQYFGLCMTERLYAECCVDVPELAVSTLTKADVVQSIQSTEKFAATVLGFTGIDLLADGVINFVPALAESLAISVPGAAAIVGGIVGVGASVALIKDYNKLQLKDYYSFVKVISSVYENIEHKYLEMYDEYIEEIRTRVEKYLVECVGANDVAINKQNALIAIKNIQSDLDDVRKDMKDSSYDPTKIIRG